MPKRKIYAYTLKQVAALRGEVREHHFSVPRGFERCSTRRLREYYNGVGAESWSPYFRKFVSYLLGFLNAPALVHDYEFSRRKKSFWLFSKANLRLVYNCAWEWHLLLGLVAGLLCEIFGYGAYKRVGK